MRLHSFPDCGSKGVQKGHSQKEPQQLLLAKKFHDRVITMFKVHQKPFLGVLEKVCFHLHPFLGCGSKGIQKGHNQKEPQQLLPLQRTLMFFCTTVPILSPFPQSLIPLNTSQNVATAKASPRSLLRSSANFKLRPETARIRSSRSTPRSMLAQGSLLQMLARHTKASVRRCHREELRPVAARRWAAHKFNSCPLRRKLRPCLELAHCFLHKKVRNARLHDAFRAPLCQSFCAGLSSKCKTHGRRHVAGPYGHPGIVVRGAANA